MSKIEIGKLVPSAIFVKMSMRDQHMYRNKPVVTESEKNRLVRIYLGDTKNGRM